MAIKTTRQLDNAADSLRKLEADRLAASTSTQDGEDINRQNANAWRPTAQPKSGSR
jgi:hypothetical protein